MLAKLLLITCESSVSGSLKLSSCLLTVALSVST